MRASYSIPASDLATTIGTGLLHITLSSMPCGPSAAAIGPSFAAPSTFSSRASSQPGDPYGFLARVETEEKRREEDYCQHAEVVSRSLSAERPDHGINI
ncbi:hypothetical protein MUK42_29734 [Musa troglodytarum]|uniref:Uncharacterized protein n=1 Tax=Musa troglodytarum TaxID=320322 RepID=A0A9E7JY86_9LILI|nr:hypothetical protein MUK42_29734 [Musa troglodytarum]